MVHPTPDELAARHDDVVRHAETFDLDAAAFERARRRADRWSVGAFVHDDGRVLFVRQDDRWFLPGGARVPGESLAAGARREVREETGVEVEITGLAAISEQTFRHGTESVPFYFATFEAVPRDASLADDPGLPGEGIESAAWHGRVPEDTFDAELVRRLFRRVLA